MVPIGIVMQELHAIGISIHRIDQAFEKIVFVFTGIQFTIFIGELLAKCFYFCLCLQNLFFGLS
jgi:hypothetical protein